MRTSVSIDRRGYALLATAYSLFVLYGSLVPLHPRAVPLSHALAYFAAVVSGPIRVESRTDFVTNVLLFVPLGYLTLAAVRTDRRGLGGHLAACLLFAVFGLVFSSCLEFTQIFVPGRTVALSDIVGETTGGVIGAVLWLVVGRSATVWFREFFAERRRNALVQHLLLAYSILFIFSQLLPLDLTINLGELAHKYRHGMILLRPFSYVHASWFDAAWDYVSDVVLNAPLGAAAVVLWTRERTRRPPVSAFAAGVAVVAGIELAQVFVGSRFADTTDVITGALGVAIGVMVATSLSSDHVVAAAPGARDGVLLPRIGVIVWVVALLAYHWRPFDFSLDPAHVSEGLRRLSTVPLFSYFLGSEFHAFTEMSRKFLLAFPLGVLLRLAVRNTEGPRLTTLRAVALAVVGFGFLLSIEIGQVFLPGRYPDVTDAIVGECGFLVGLWVVGLLTLPRKERTFDSHRAHADV